MSNQSLLKAYTQKYKKAKKAAKEAGDERIGAIAGINHPVFKNKKEYMLETYRYDAEKRVTFGITPLPLSLFPTNLTNGSSS